MDLVIRKVVSTVETTRLELGREVPGLRRKVATAVVMANPLAGRFQEDLSELVELGAALGAVLIEEALAVLCCEAEAVTSYGKAAVVGSAGEIEHAAALIHPRFGAPIRARLGKGPAIIPSTKLMGGPGTRIVAPLTSCTDIWSFDEMDAVALSIDDAPRADEVLVVLGLGVGGRPLHRITKPGS
jgi:hypothetical protein